MLNKRLKTRFIIGVAVLAAGILLAYLPALRGGFVWDDDFWITGNPHVTGSKSIWRVWYTQEVPGQNYPLTYTFFRAQYLLWGLNPFGFHLSNLLLHILNTLLLWLILVRLKVRGGWLAAAFFGFHPLMVESVAWITEAKNTLSAFLLFSSFLFFLRFEEDGKRGRYALALFVYLLALCAKTFVAPFPLVMLVIRWYQGRPVNGRYLKWLAPFVVLSLLAGGFTWWYEVEHVGVTGAEWALTPLQRMVIAGRAFWFYLGKIVFPVRLTFIYPRWNLAGVRWESLIWPLAAVMVLVILWKLRRRMGKGPFVALACYVVFLSPALGFISFYAQIYSFVADHYVYLASIGPFALLAALLLRITGSTRLRPAAMAVLPAILAVLTFRQACSYHSLDTLYRDSIDKNPGADMPYNNLGVILFNRGRVEEGMEYYRTAIRLRPRSAYAHNNLGVALLQAGQAEEAVASFEEAIRIRPQTAGFYVGLASALKALGKTKEAVPQLREAVRRKPDLISARLDLGDALADLGRPGEAIEVYRGALKADPASVEARASLVNALARQGEFVEAIRFYRELVKADPGNARAHYNLGVALKLKGESREAALQFKRVIELKPDYPKVRHELESLNSDDM